MRLDKRSCLLHCCYNSCTCFGVEIVILVADQPFFIDGCRILQRFMQMLQRHCQLLLALLLLHWPQSCPVPSIVPDQYASLITDFHLKGFNLDIVSIVSITL